MASRDSTKSPAPRAWRALDECNAPQVPGCYAVFFDGELVYLGSSQNLHQRLRAHNIRPQYGPGYFTPWAQTDSHVVIRIAVTRRFGEWAMREIRLINRLRPRFNKRIG